MSSILETFYILFEADASKVEEGANKAKATTDKLNKSLDQADKKSQQVGGAFASLIRSAGLAFTAIFSIGALTSGMKSASDYAYSISTLSYALNMNIEDLSAWSDAVKIYGGSTETFSQNVTHLNTELQAFATTGHGKIGPFFKDLGISMKDAAGNVKSVTQILPEIAGAFEKMDKSKSFGIGKKLGLDQSTIMLLQEGRREVELVIRRQKELGVVTQEDVDAVVDFRHAELELDHSFRTFYTTLNTMFLPVLKSIKEKTKDVVDFFNRHKPLIEGVLIAIGAAATLASVGLIKFIWPIIRMAGPVGALIGLFGLLYDDIKTFYAGGDSLLGRLIDKFPILTKVLKIVEDTIKQVGDNMIMTGEMIANMLQAIWDGMVAGAELAVTAIKAVKNAFSDSGDSPSIFVKAGTSAKGDKKYFFGQNENLEKAKYFMNEIATAPIALQAPNSFRPSNSSNTKTNNITIGDINITSNTDNPYDMATQVKDHLTKQISQANANFDTGRLA